ncbi:MAG: MerR family transcriptional regulator, partial [Mycobacteriales bacterium]
MSYSVGQVSELAGVTVRTLHYYDGLGLLTPSERSSAGYRCYSDIDLERLQQILYYRELGFSLTDITTVVNRPKADAGWHLRRQRQLLTERITRLSQMMAAIDKALEAHTMGISLTPEERFEIFGDFDPGEHAAEADQRWGSSDAFRDSQRRAANYTADDWRLLKTAGATVEQSFATALRTGAPADSELARSIAEQHRLHLNTWFYHCDHQMHRGLGRMYSSDAH